MINSERLIWSRRLDARERWQDSFLIEGREL